MKKVAALLLCCAFILSGCAVVGETSYLKTDPNYDYSQDSRYPPGKTDDDWVREEMECRTSSGKIVGFLSQSIFGLIHNWGEVNDKYDACMKDKGWLR